MFISGTTVTAITATVGGVITYLLGGWDILIQALCLMMCMDIVSGLMKSLYRKSEKTHSGCFSSTVFYNGLLKKGAGLLVVVVAVQIDLILADQGVSIMGLTDTARNAVIIFFWLGEVMSVIENVGQMGITLPAPIRRALDIFYDGLKK